MKHIQNVLVTGGLGFIGSHYTRLMVKKGYNTIVLDNMTYAADENRINDIRDDIVLYVGNINDDKIVRSIIKENDINIIVNFAAETMVDRSIKDSKPFIHSNIEGVQNILDIVVDNNIERFVQISTDECYGSTKYGDQKFKETDKLNPGNPYAASKAAADLLCAAYKNTYGLDIVITRSSNNYGQYQHTEKYIPRMISLAIQGKDLEVYGNGNNIRDWLYVLDNVNAIQIVTEKGRKGEIYNIGTGEEKTNNEIAEIVAKRFGVGIKYIEDRRGHDMRYSINCDKIEKELGWKPVKKFEDGINDTIEWYIKEGV